MPEFTWTAPDPLVTGVKSRSIYITELQDAVNIKRAEIGQSAHNFIDQSVGETYRLSAVEELKTKTNELALDFGFAGGVTHSDLLGRDYVDHPIVLGEPAAGFPIINDLRRILENMVQQQAFEITVVTEDYYLVDTSGESEPENLEVEDDTLFSFPLDNEPWKQAPLFSQGVGNKTGGGTDCPEGYPTCDNNISGTFNANVVAVTDKSVRANFSGVFREGPLGGPYFEAPVPDPDNTDSEGDSFVVGNSNLFDENYYYLVFSRETTFGDSFDGVEVYRRPRDGSEGWELKFTSTNSFFTDVPGFNEIVGKNVIFFYRFGFGSQNIEIAVLDKSGFSITFHTIPFQNLAGDDELDIIDSKNSGSNNIAYRDGALEFLYAEGHFSSGTPDFVRGTSAIARFTEAGVISFRDLSTLTSTKFGPGVGDKPTIWTKYAEFDSPTSPFAPIIDVLPLRGAKNDGIWHAMYDEVKDDFENGTETNEKIFAFEGTQIMIDELDYKGDKIDKSNEFTGLDIREQVAEVYLDRAAVTPNITDEPEVSVTNRQEDTGDITELHDKATATVSAHIPGSFRYRIECRPVGGSFWTTCGNIQSFEDPLETEITGLDKDKDYEVRAVIESGIGEFAGDSVTVNKVVPSQPENVQLSIDINDDVQVDWDAPSSGPSVNGYKVKYRVVPSLTFTEVDVGNVLTHTITGLSSGDEVKVRVAAYNSFGTGLFTPEETIIKP